MILNRYAPLFLIALAGCKSSGLSLTQASFPVDPSTKQQELRIGSTKMDVDVVQSLQNGVLVIQVNSHKVEVDREKYKLDGSGLSLVEASYVTFQPPLPLLKFPTGGSETLNWSGSLHEPTSIPASAKVTVTPQKFTFDDHDEQGLFVNVTLSIDSGTAVPSQRVFEFSGEFARHCEADLCRGHHENRQRIRGVWMIG